MPQFPRKKSAVDIVRGPKESPDCADCPLAHGGRPKSPVAGEGPRNPKFIIVGEGPGRQEVQQSRPFVGPTGKLLMKVLADVGVEREEVYLANATLCAPGKDKGRLERAMQCCRPRLMRELARFPSVPIATLGAHAGHSVLDDDTFKITELAGSLFEIEPDPDVGTRDVITAIHPAAILRSGSGTSKQNRAGEMSIWSFTYDIAKVKSLAEGDESVRFSWDIDYELEDPARATEAIEEIYADALELGFVAIDIETSHNFPGRKNDPQPLDCWITSFGVATARWAFSAPWEIWAEGPAWQTFVTMCADPRVQLVYHNRQFDEQVLGRPDYGVIFGGERHDTMLMHHSAFPGAEHDLQRVATQFFALTPWKSNYRHGDGEMEEELEYNAKDVLATARLREPLERCMERTNSWRTYEVDNALAPRAMRMEAIGVPLNREANAELAEQFLDVMDRTREVIEARAADPEVREKFIDHLAYQRARKKRKADPPGFLERHAVRMRELRDGVRGKKGSILKGKEPVEFSISNPDHVIAYVQAIGCKLTKQTATGKYSGDKEVLEALTHIEDVRLILDYRDAAYLYSHFVRIDEGDGRGLYLDEFDRFHPSWLIHKITGRWGSSPNAQNWPLARAPLYQDGDSTKPIVRPARPNLRKQVIPAPGWKLVYVDKSQLEARIIAMLSGDPFLLEILMGALDCRDCDAAPPGKFCPLHDVHTVFACAVWEDFLDKPSELRRELRDLVKRAEYGGFYGGALDTLFQTIVKERPEVTKKEVAQVVHIISTKMPEVAKWHNGLMKQAIQQGQIESAILGRRRCFPLGRIDPNIVRNHPVQSTAADIMSLDMLRFYDALEETDYTEAEVILQVHDSIVVECWEEHADDIAEIMTDCFTHTYEASNGIKMHFPGEAEVKDCWG